MNKLIKRLFLRAVVLFVIYVVTSAVVFYFYWMRPKYVVPILMYHNFGYVENNSLYVTPENFEKQMQYLKTKEYNVISLDELVDGINAERHFPHNTVVITVDDGYKDNYTLGFPVMKRYGFPVTIFIEAGDIGKEADFMDWEQVKEMNGEGVTFGAHTVTGAYLPAIKEADNLWYEIVGAKQIIKEKLGVDPQYFCYPIGGFTERAKDFVKFSGYKGACSTNRGFVELNKDVYELKRIKVKNSDANKPFAFAAKLSGYYNLFRSRKSGH